MPAPRGSSSRDWESVARRRLSRLLSAARGVPQLRGLGPPGARWKVGIRIAGRPEIARLNRGLRGVRGPTDVLSFPAPEPFFSHGQLGDLCVCLPIMRAQARERGLEPEMELQILLAHGLLHLLGLDHERGARKAREMARLESRLLARATPRTWVARSGGRCLSGLIERLESSIPRRHRWPRPRPSAT